MTTTVFGIRHHGPGSARSLVHALEQLQPDAVLIEGPPDADKLLPLAGDQSLRPPVALLVYRPDAPRRAVFYPFAEFSPEWQAIQFALTRGIAVRFMDLPQAFQLGDKARATLVETEEDADGGEPEATVQVEASRPDPMTVLAAAAGYDDPELWWEHQVERRRDASGLFEAITEVMRTLRDETPISPHDLRREAYMRRTIRAAVAEGRERIAVICGAWHAPVLPDGATASADAQLLKGLPKTKVEAAWIPWTYSRLSYRSGYGAGVDSPGWYHHVWTAPERAPVRFLVEAARLLRSEDLEAPSASVIEAARLADALAGLRELAGPGLPELREAALAVFCRGQPAPLRLVHERLEVGSVLGAVPESASVVPLQRDLRDTQRRLRLKVDDQIRTLDLDLRKDNDRLRSLLFHRLRLLDIEWAEPQESGGTLGTFHEFWQVQWNPEMEVALVEASVWGATIADAATARARHLAQSAQDLDALTKLLDRVILADLPDALDHVLSRVQERAAVSSDVRRLMAALLPLARVSRYGDVRRTPTARLAPIIDGLFERILVGLPLAVVSLDEEAAMAMTTAVAGVQQALDLLERVDEREEWMSALSALMSRNAAHPMIRGYSARLLLDAGRIEDAELGRIASRELSPAVPPLDAASWLSGLLRGNGFVLVHHQAVWYALDVWLSALSAEQFPDMLPLVRRAFSGFSTAERRAMAERIAKPATQPRTAVPVAEPTDVDTKRAAAVLPVLARILGVRPPEGSA
jgi:hypothetical protein